MREHWGLDEHAECGHAKSENALSKDFPMKNGFADPIKDFDGK